MLFDTLHNQIQSYQFKLFSLIATSVMNNLQLKPLSWIEANRKHTTIHTAQVRPIAPKRILLPPIADYSMKERILSL